MKQTPCTKANINPHTKSRQLNKDALMTHMFLIGKWLKTHYREVPTQTEAWFLSHCDHIPFVCTIWFMLLWPDYTRAAFETVPYNFHKRNPATATLSSLLMGEHSSVPHRPETYCFLTFPWLLPPERKGIDVNRSGILGREKLGVLFTLGKDSGLGAALLEGTSRMQLWILQCNLIALWTVMAEGLYIPYPRRNPYSTRTVTSWNFIEFKHSELVRTLGQCLFLILVHFSPHTM